MDFLRVHQMIANHIQKMIPPPNVTGVLHMGHMLNNTIQDVLVRRARMAGKKCMLGWPGTDHASIATEKAKVVSKLKEEGIEKRDLKHVRSFWSTHGNGPISMEA